MGKYILKLFLAALVTLLAFAAIIAGIWYATMPDFD
jgi:hypothetical protein